MVFLADQEAALVHPALLGQGGQEHRGKGLREAQIILMHPDMVAVVVEVLLQLEQMPHLQLAEMVELVRPIIYLVPLLIMQEEAAAALRLAIRLE
jgi:hypothetical protein